MDAAEIGARIRERRKALRLGQDAIAEAIGVARSTVSLYERGKVSISADALHKVADLLKVPVGYLIGEISYEEVVNMDDRARRHEWSVAEFRNPSQPIEHGHYPEPSESLKQEILAILDLMPDQFMQFAVDMLGSLAGAARIESQKHHDTNVSSALAGQNSKSEISGTPPKSKITK